MLQALVVLTGRVYTRLGEGASGSGLFMALAVDFWAFLFLPFHYPPLSALGRFLLSSPMDKQQHKYMRIQITPAVDTAPPPWCHSSTLLLDFLPLNEHVTDWQALKWSTAGCQIYAPFHFEVHQFFGSECSPQCEFFYSIEH